MSKAFTLLIRHHYQQSLVPTNMGHPILRYCLSKQHHRNDCSGHPIWLFPLCLYDWLDMIDANNFEYRSPMTMEFYRYKNSYPINITNPKVREIYIKFLLWHTEISFMSIVIDISMCWRFML